MLNGKHTKRERECAGALWRLLALRLYPLRGGESVKDLTTCKYCKEKGYLVMNIGIVDEVCEACGKWQRGKYGDMYERLS